MSDHELHDLKMKEQWLREELRSTRSLMNSTIHWGVAVLTAASLNLFYLRRDVRGQLNIDYVPFKHWIIGTIFLFVLSCVFYSVLRRHRERFRHHRTRLSEMHGGYSGISEDLPGGIALLQLIPEVLFLTFPLLDLALWVLLYCK